jgi:hemerythrin-like domain-containing protein
MEVLTKLSEEHAHILRGLYCLEKSRDALEQNRRPLVDFFKTAVLFFTEYADKLHHYKEEYLLFSFLASKKRGKIDLEIGALRRQHELNRHHIKKIRESLQGYETGSEIAATTLLENLAAYISILKRHIQREDRIFFPMAEAELSGEEKKQMLDQFFEEETASSSRKIIHDNLSRLVIMENMISEI